MQQLMQVASAPLTSEVSIVCRRDETDSFGGTSKHIADRVGEHLKFISLETNFIMHNVVMGGTCRALESTMSCLDE